MESAKESLRTLVVTDVIEKCSVSGLLVKTTSKNEEVEYNHAPISLFPTPFSAQLYDRAKTLQPHLGIMVNDLVQRPDLMQEILMYFKRQDPFLHRLLVISEQYNKLPLKQDIQLCILRSDYMADKITKDIKLVEYNTIASSFGCLCQKVRETQKYVLSKYGDQLNFNYEDYSKLDDGLGKTYIRDIGLVFLRTLNHYLESMNARFPEKYSERKSSEFWVLFVIDKGERNICDQKLIENEIFENYGVKSYRMTFAQIAAQATRDTETNALIIQGHEIGFVYYRTGYQQEQYDDDTDWLARETLEFSMPIKCPSIDVHLTTFKKFQQAFSDDSLLSRVMENHQDDKDKIKHLFKGIWTLEDIEDEASDVQLVIKNAIENPHNYVIKPQKEGGGNNYYDEEVKNLLIQNDKDYLKQFLIMERIYPPEIKAYMLRNGKVIETQTLSELGIFSSVFIDATKQGQGPIENITFGRLLRTKGSDSNEGGVNAGFAVIDQPLIVEIEDISTAEIKPLVQHF